MTRKEKIKTLEALAEVFQCSISKAAYYALADYYDGAGMEEFPFEAILDTMTNEELIAEYLKI